MSKPKVYAAAGAPLHYISGNSAQRSPEIVEFTKQGEFVKELSVDPAQGGSFGLAVSSTADQAIFAAVDDNTSMLTIWTLNLE
jgi:hypothetical protein